MMNKISKYLEEELKNMEEQDKEIDFKKYFEEAFKNIEEEFIIQNLIMLY